MLEVKDISARLGSFELSKLSFHLQEGDYLTVLGLSGAGKTVLLEVIAGLVTARSGTIVLNGKNITHQSIQKRKVGLVYQDMALFPHLTVKKNIAYPLWGRGLSKEAINKQVEKLATLTRVPHLLNRQPATLSGGEAQRVALARILASDPELLLLDEPLASLDVKLRQELRELLRQINQQGKTIIHVTHDYMEAATLSKKIAIIENGKLLQWGNPDEVFRNPVSEFVARFSGIKNIFACTFEPSAQNNGVFTGKSPKGNFIRLTHAPRGNEAHLMIPGEDIIISGHQLQTSAMNQYKGIITNIYPQSHGIEVIVDAGEEFSVAVTKKSMDALGLAREKEVWISFKASAVKIL